MRSATNTIALAVFIATLGCAPSLSPKRTIDLAAVKGEEVRGLALHGDTLHLIVKDRGIVEVDGAGALVSEHKLGEHGLAAADYKDIAVLDGDALQYVLIKDDDGTVYDPQAESQTVRFCVLPGPPIDDTRPITTQKNDALAVSGNSILANPRFYDGDALQSATLRTYRLDDGTPVNDVDVGMELAGLAVGLDGIYGVHDDTLELMSPSGTAESSTHLDGVANATGLAVDNAAGELWVLDGARVAVFDAP